MPSINIFKIIVLIILIMLSAFFSSAETAFSCSNKIRLKAKSDEGKKSASLVLKICESYSKLISCILICNNVVNLTASSLTTTIAVDTGLPMAVSIATGALTVAVLMCGEIIPKTWANLHADNVACFYAPIFNVLLFIMTPIIFIVDKVTKAIMFLLHIDPNKKAEAITEHELRTILDEGHEGGAIEEDEREMIDNVFDFGDVVAKDIMIPRIDMVMVDINTDYKTLMKVFRENMYTRIPVYEDTQDNVIGIINIKDFILVKNPDTFNLKKYIRDVYYTYEYKKTSDLLTELRTSYNTVAMVLNEYGATEGMVTLEDLLEEIVGDIRDEYDKDEEELIEDLGDNTYLIPGNMKMDDVNDNLDTEFDSEDYDTLAGLIIDQIDKIPKEGEEVTLPDGTILTAEIINKNRIQLVKVKLPSAETEEETENEESTEE